MTPGSDPEGLGDKLDRLLELVQPDHLRQPIPRPLDTRISSPEMPTRRPIGLQVQMQAYVPGRLTVRIVAWGGVVLWERDVAYEAAADE